MNSCVAAMRVDRFLSNLAQFNRKQVRLLLVERRVSVDGVIVSDPHHDVREFSRVCVDDNVLQAGKPARYFMLHKPQGLCECDLRPATPHGAGLLHEPDKADLHIAGRLDFNTTGLMLITNDGQWSRRLTQPTTKLPKVYLVDTEQAIGTEYAHHVRRGPVFCLRRPHHPTCRT